jgi:hypothetical protein
MSNIIPKRALTNGRWDKKLKENMVALSVADNYNEAKHEWIATGQVWWELLGDIPNWANQHSHKCLCGHDIVYHFEIHNTETDVRECVGSDHINSYLILRAIHEETGVATEHITDAMIEEWINVRVQSLKKEAWWKVHGDQFTEMFDAVKDLDLRINVRKKGRYYDETYRQYRDKTYIRKRADGNFGAPDYRMASIVWRWNHPENPKAQTTRLGYPNQRLFNDLMIFYYSIEKAKVRIEKEDKKLVKRLDHLKEFDEQQRLAREAEKERREKLVAEVETQENDPIFQEACEYYGVKPFIPEQGDNTWERKFLLNIKKQMLSGKPLSEKQTQRLWIVLNNENAVQEPASERQKQYLVRLGYEGDVDSILKNDASFHIQKLKEEQNKRV